jgi:hypothetical protein
LDIDGDGQWTAGLDQVINYGQRGDQSVIGDWDHSGKLRIGVFRSGHWDGPCADKNVAFGQAGDVTSLFQCPVRSQAK